MKLLTLAKMDANVAGIEPIFTSKRTQLQLSKALATLGFGAWNELESGNHWNCFKQELSLTS